MYLKYMLVFFVFCWSQISFAEEQVGPKWVVDKLNTVLIDVMKNAQTLGYQGRLKKLDGIVRDTHEFGSIAQIALGSHWQSLEQEQKDKFVEKLTELSVATYAAQFKSYGGEEFKYDSEQALKSNRMMLRYTLVAPHEKPVKFDYMLAQTDGHWAIINIIVDGISDLALKKAQYGSVIDREGFDSLLGKLAQKVIDYSSNNPS